MAITSTISPAMIIGLRFFGLWPGVPYSIIYWLSFMLSLLFIQYFQYLYIFNHLKISEMSNLVDALIVTLDYSLTFFKLTGLWIHRRVFHKILADMDNDWCESININHHLHTMTIKANIAHLLSNSLLSLNVFLGTLYYLGDYIVHSAFLTEHGNDTARHLPMKIQFPFEIQHTQLLIFEFIAATLFLYAMLQAWTIALLNGLIFTLVFHVSGQIDIICQELKIISNIFLHKSSIPSFGMLVERHNRVIKSSENIEQLFSFITLMQVTWNTLVICCLGFALIISIHNETGVFVVVKMIFGYLAVTMENFIICFVGEHLSFKSKSIARTIYETPWYDIPSNQSKIIVFIMMRSQKRLTITAGKIMDMSFETFTSIMKASASYVSVLNAMY